MGEIDHEIAGKVAGLQTDISSVLQELQGMPEDHPRYEALFAQLVNAGSALLAYETQAPAKREEPHRQVSKTALTWTGRVHALAAVLLGLAPLTGWIGWGWVALAVFQLLFGLLATGMDAPVQGHRELRIAAGVLGAVTVLVPLLVFDVLSGWFWIAAAIGWIGSFVRTARCSGPAPQSGSGLALHPSGGRALRERGVLPGDARPHPRPDRGPRPRHRPACLTRQILVLADRAYQGACATFRTPYYHHSEQPDQYQQFNRDHGRLRAPGERAFAQLKTGGSCGEPAVPPAAWARQSKPSTLC